MSTEFTSGGRLDYVKCSCQSCGGHFEVPSDYLGEVRDCPHCKNSTLIQEFTEEKPSVAQPTIVPAQKAPFTTELYDTSEILPMRPSGRHWPGVYDIAAVIGFLVGCAMFIDSLVETDTKTVFQQIAGRIFGVGGFLIAGLAILVGAVSDAAKTLQDISERLHGIESRAYWSQIDQVQKSGKKPKIT